MATNDQQDFRINTVNIIAKNRHRVIGKITEYGCGMHDIKKRKRYTRVNLDQDEFERWKRIKTEHKIRNNQSVAKFLLDSYEEYCKLKAKQQKCSISQGLSTQPTENLREEIVESVEEAAEEVQTECKDRDPNGDGDPSGNYESLDESTDPIGLIDLVSITDTEDQDLITEDQTCLVYKNSLLTLAKMAFPTLCPKRGCTKRLVIRHTNKGSAVYLQVKCTHGHHFYTWCSQPIINNIVHAGNLTTAFAISASGINISKFRSFARLMKLHFISESEYYDIESVYIKPALEEQLQEISEHSC